LLLFEVRCRKRTKARRFLDTDARETVLISNGGGKNESFDRVVGAADHWVSGRKQ
jgi:hypothetical protein